MSENSNTERIRFELHSNLIIVPLKINGTTLKFILDSGTKQNLLLDKTMVSIIDTINLRSIQISGLGNNSNILAFISSKNKIELGNLFDHDSEMMILANIDLDLSSKIGTTIHGILGIDAFKNYLVEINYNSSTLIFRKNITKRILKKFKPKDIEIDRDKFFIKANPEMDSMYSNLKFLIDTGNSDAIWLFDNKKLKINYPKKYFEEILGVGIGGDITGKKSKIKSFAIDDYFFKNPIISLPDSSSIKNIVEIYPDRNGSIGGEILKRFVTIFDFKNKKIYLKKSGFYKNPFLYDLSGMTIFKPYPNIPFFEIYSIRKNSPAYFADIRKGDILTEINNHKVFDLDLDTIIQTFKEKKDKKISITIERNGNLLNKKFVLQDFL